MSLLKRNIEIEGDTLIVIGDVHGYIDDYKNIIKDIDGPTIQLGDFGFAIEHDRFMSEVRGKFEHDHKILFGNHDDYQYLDKDYSLGDIGIYNGLCKIMTVRGSILRDSSKRLEGYTWFREEQLNYTQFSEIMDEYESVKPDIMISHDCPMSIRKECFQYTDEYITTRALQELFELHRPKIWIFGHYHRYMDKEINGTRFICLTELGHCELNLKEITATYNI